MTRADIAPQIVLITGAGSGIGRAIAQALARAGHTVYAGLRAPAGASRNQAEDLEGQAVSEGLDLQTIELDVLSEASCRAAADRVLMERGRIDVVVNNAGMLLVGVTEACSPEDAAQVFETNAISWLRVNRAVLPAMRRQRRGLMIYIGSTTARIHEPFIGVYCASKAAGEALAEVMGMEALPFGIETVIVQPGAFTTGTDHFAHAKTPANLSVVEQYGEVLRLADNLPAKLDAIDAAEGGSKGVSLVGDAVRDLLALPVGSRPARLVVDPQAKGVEALNALHDETQSVFLARMGLDALTAGGR